MSAMHGTYLDVRRGGGHGSGSDDLDARKYIYLLALFLATLLSCYAPKIFACFLPERTVAIQVLGNLFAGGILLGVTLQHIMPELFHLLPSSDFNDYPLAGLLMMVGFCFMMIFQSIREDHDQASCNMVAKGMVGMPASGATVNDIELKDAEDDEPGARAEDDEATSKAATQALIFVAGLGGHSVFEGLLLGTTSESSTLDTLFVGIISHKVFVGVALGALLEKRCTMLWVTIGNVIFSAATPLGVLIGILAHDNSSNHVNGSISSVAGGITLYVAMFEMCKPLTQHDASESIASKKVLSLVFLLGCIVAGLISLHSMEGGHEH